MFKAVLATPLITWVIFSYAQTPSRQIPTSQLVINSTVKLESLGDSIIRGGGLQTFSTTGTGFYFLFKIDTILLPVLVTNSHVIKNTGMTQMVLTERGDNQQPLNGHLITFNNDNHRNRWIHHPRYDLAILPLFSILESIHQQSNKKVYFMPFEEALIPNDSTLRSFSAIEEVLMLGYPKGYWDSKNNYPIVRKGTTATPVFSNFNNKSEFLVDVPIYSGSSGSPVVLFDEGSYSSGNGLVAGSRIFLLGIATQSIDFKNRQASAVPDNPLNIAVVIKASALSEFKPILKELIMQEQELLRKAKKH